MFANPTKVGISQRVVATLVACAVVLWTLGVHATAQAADLVSVSDTLSDSDLSATAAHTISFTIPTGSTLANTDTVSITFPGAFTNTSSVVGGDLTVTVDGGADTATNFAESSGTISFDGIDATAGQVVVVAIADGKITNPASAGSYELTVDTGNGDSGKTRVAIVDNVLVTAVVNTTFDFTIDGVATSTGINGTSTTGSSTPTALDFGVLTAGEIKALGQQLNVRTNARNGFVVTVESDGDLQSSNGAVIDNFADGSDVSAPGTAWAAPTNDVNDETTWGHWGLTTNDSDLGSLGGFYSSTDFSSGDFIAASTTAREVFHHDGPADNSTQDIGLASVLYQVEITGLQEAADDYNTTLTYIATPTF